MRSANTSNTVAWRRILWWADLSPSGIPSRLPTYVKILMDSSFFFRGIKHDDEMTSSPYFQFHLEYWTLRNGSTFSFNLRNNYWQKSRARNDSFRYWNGSSPAWRTGGWKFNEICHVQFFLFCKCFRKENMANSCIRRKVDWRMLPLLGILSALSLIDRSNLGLARASGMDHDLVCFFFLLYFHADLDYLLKAWCKRI